MYLMFIIWPYIWIIQSQSLENDKYSKITLGMQLALEMMELLDSELDW